MGMKVGSFFLGVSIHNGFAQELEGGRNTKERDGGGHRKV